MSVAYIQQQSAFIHDKAFPIVPVQKQSDRYFKYTKDFWFRTAAAKRGPGTESVGTGFHIDNTPSYFADVWAIHHDVDDDSRANADDPINVDVDATEFVSGQLLLRREKLFLANYLKTGLWQGFSSGDFAPNTNGAGYWDSATSNPMLDVDNVKKYMMSQTGFAPNVLIITQNVYFALRNHPIVLDRIKYTQRGLVTEDLLATLFGIEKILVSGAVFNSAQEGQTASMAFGATNQFLLCYAAPSPGLKRPSAGYIFSWVGRLGNGAYGNRIKKFRMEHLESDRVEGEMAFSMQVVSPDLGVLGINVLQNP